MPTATLNSFERLEGTLPPLSSIDWVAPCSVEFDDEELVRAQLAPALEILKAAKTHRMNAVLSLDFNASRAVLYALGSGLVPSPAMNELLATLERFERVMLTPGVAGRSYVGLPALMRRLNKSPLRTQTVLSWDDEHVGHCFTALFPRYQREYAVPLLDASITPGELQELDISPEVPAVALRVSSVEQCLAHLDPSLPAAPWPLRWLVDAPGELVSA